MNNEKIILITGSSSGIGKNLCNILNNEGYTVIATARNLEKLSDVSASLKLKLDVTNIADIKKIINTILSKYGKIDILINNAGYSVRGAIEDMDMILLKDMFDVNLFGLISVTKEVIPIMRKQGYGKIMNIGSSSGLFAQKINGVYCASKFGVEAITEALRLELSQFNIQSCVIEPGSINTNFFNNLKSTSTNILGNQNSPYINVYNKNNEYIKKQKKADPFLAAQQISKILKKKKWKIRYKVCLPLSIRLLIHFPSCIKEEILKRQ